MTPLQLLQQAVENVKEKPVRVRWVSPFEYVLQSRDHERSLRVAWRLAYKWERTKKERSLMPVTHVEHMQYLTDNADAEILIAQLEAKSGEPKS